MTYQVLARKWRPQDFASLVGQEPIVTALRNALLEGRIAQAYVFSGIRGVGKTTAARVFAKALNCERPIGSAGRSGADPCNDCLACTEITSGADIDVLEIDAATHSKVEQVRELTESLRYGAARDRYKVVVLDEVHRLSRQAFDALLKIVEEPPEHLVFIFATTELDAVPATVLSRCQEFQFRRVPSPVLASHLRSIADAESITVSDAALRMIARAGEGSVRDAVALLDQLATYGSGGIDDQDANRLLGGLDAEIFRRLLSGILAGDHASILGIVHEVEENDWDPHHVYGQFLAYARGALHLSLGSKPETIELALEEAIALGHALETVPYERLMQLAQLLLSGELIVRRSEFGLLALEITWLRAAELPKVTRVEDLLAGRTTVRDARESNPTAPASTAPASTAPSSTGELSSPSATADTLERFRRILSLRPPLAARLADDQVRLVFQAGVLRVHTAGDAPSLQKALARQGNAETLSQALVEIWGEGTRYEVVSAVNGDQPAARNVSPAPRPAPRAATISAPPAGAPQRDPLWARAESDPLVRTVLANFPGPITSVQRRDRRQQG